MLDFSSLNENQLKAVTHGTGPLLILAGPGSGKTHTIINRIFYLLQQGICPESILVITFTKAAATSMQQRFSEEADSYYPVQFKTFHSLFYQILSDAGRIGSNGLLSNVQKRNILNCLLKKNNPELIQKNTEEEINELINKIFLSFSYYKNACDLQKAKDMFPHNEELCFDVVLKQYTDYLRQKKLLDFDDLLYECKELLLKESEIKRKWQNRFQHILIDEFQDCNQIQYEILKLLTKEPYSIFAVGDDDQAIYGFRGSKPGIMSQFQKEYQAGCIVLNINYRSDSKIIHAAERIISENKDRFPKHMVGKEEEILKIRDKRQKSETENTVFDIIGFANREQEYCHLISVLNDWNRMHKADAKQCAVLFRTNLYMQGLAARLYFAGIPFEMKERNKSIYETFFIKDIMSYFKIAHGMENREDLVRTINKVNRFVYEEAIAESESLEEIILWHERHKTNSLNLEKSLQKLQLLKLQFTRLKSLSFSLGISFIMKALDYEKYLARISRGNLQRMEEWLEAIEWLKEDSKKYHNLKDWVEMQQSCGRNLSELKETDDKKCIRLMTVHASKGLEFDKVIIPDCNENIFPNGREMEESKVEEERRIFYVGVTRAKENLELLYLTGDSVRPRFASRFLNPFLYSSSSINSSNSQLSKYSSKASATFSYSSSSAI